MIHVYVGINYKMAAMEKATAAYDVLTCLCIVHVYACMYSLFCDSY